MSMLRHRFSNERWGGGRPEPPSSLICNSVYFKKASFIGSKEKRNSKILAFFTQSSVSAIYICAQGFVRHPFSVILCMDSLRVEKSNQVKSHQIKAHRYTLSSKSLLSNYHFKGYEGTKKTAFGVRYPVGSWASAYVSLLTDFHLGFLNMTHSFFLNALRIIYCTVRTRL